MHKGFFITIYGINNIGKSTQAKRLVEYLRKIGYKAVFLKYPIYDLVPTGQQLNKILRSENKQSITEEELQTLFVQNRKDFEPTLKKLLADGTIVVAEDYSGTGIAWGVAKGANQQWLENLNRDLLKEDLAILLTGKRNIHAREKTHIHETNDQLVEKVGQILLELAEKHGWQKIEIQPTRDETAQIIWYLVEKKIPPL